MPEDLSKGFPYIHKMVKALNLPILVKPGFEADDLIGTMVERAKKEKIDSVIVSGDKDFMQLIGPAVQMYKPKWPNDWSMADEKDVLEKFGVKPEQVIDVLALMGDASDNVPGVPGIGEKTATVLIQEYGTLDNLFKNVEKIQKPKLKESLLKNKAMADLSKELVTIECDAPIPDRPKNMVLGKPDMGELRELCHELEFNRMMSRIEEYAGTLGVEFSLSSPPESTPKEKKGKAAKKEKMEAPEPVEIKVKIVSDKYRSLLTEEEIEKALAAAAKTGLVAVDTETTGLDSLTVDI